VLARQILIFSCARLSKTALHCMETDLEKENEVIGKTAVISNKVLIIS
jgi:hypothetical protein